MTFKSLLFGPTLCMIISTGSLSLDSLVVLYIVVLKLYIHVNSCKTGAETWIGSLYKDPWFFFFFFFEI